MEHLEHKKEETKMKGQQFNWDFFWLDCCFLELLREGN